MQPGKSPDVTVLLTAWRDGSGAALEQLMPLVYGELRRIAEHHIRRERPGHTLQPTALIHEAYIRLLQGGQQPSWENRVHFFGVASRLMRQVLVDWARRTQSQKRGGEAAKVSLDEALAVAPDSGSTLVALDEALNDLAEFDERACRAVEMKYFGGLTIDETATALGISVATVSRTLRVAEAWLRNRLSGNSAA
jgi:RNA polymerase sigma factor (TIGR02999 family)